MNRLLALGVVLIVAVSASGAWSAPTQTPTESKLVRDVATLKAQVKALQADVKKVRKVAADAHVVAVGLGLIGACSTALTADGLQGTWQVIDDLSAATQAGKTVFGAQTPVSDTIGGEAICQTIGAPRSHVVPPTVAPFSALLALFQKEQLLARQLR